MQNKDPPPICILLFMRCDHIVTEHFFLRNKHNKLYHRESQCGEKQRSHCSARFVMGLSLFSVPSKDFPQFCLRIYEKNCFSKKSLQMLCIHREYRGKVVCLLPNYLYTCISAYETCICIFSKYMHIYTCMYRNSQCQDSLGSM